jgi:hypothetical protein
MEHDILTKRLFEIINTRELSDLIIDLRDPYSLGDSSIFSEWSNEYSESEFEINVKDYYRHYLEEWFDVEFGAAQIYNFLLQDPTFQEDYVQECFKESMQEELEHAAIAYYFYKTAIGEAPKIKYMSKPIADGLSMLPIMVLSEAVAVAVISTWKELTHDSKKQKFFNTMVVDDAKHIKRIKKIFQNKRSLISTQADARLHIRNNMSWVNEGLVGFSNTIDRSKFSSDSKISMLKKSVKYSKQSILFQKHFNSLVGAWINQNYEILY